MMSSKKRKMGEKISNSKQKMSKVKPGRRGPSVVILLLGILLLANVVLMATLSNLNFGFLMQSVLALGVILYALLFGRIPKKVHRVVGALCLIPLACSLFLFVYGNVGNVDFSEDVAIVLGAGIRGETVSRTLAHRLDSALDYWRQNPQAYIIVCGGLGNRAVITEAEAMARYLVANGVDRDKILLEDLSTSTFENLTFAAEILNGRFPDGYRAVLITSDFHTFRAGRIARHLGIAAGWTGSYTDWYTWPQNYLREMVAVLNMWRLMLIN